ncbi:GNAT family N-acetyltransferase [Candidatus Pacearchaeota archaeon]|nr:GNAT family N-acetyltransferase [Candidatus Pacearchaeota archaeon]
MKIIKARKNEKKESLEIAEELKEWFKEDAIKKMRKNFNKNLYVLKNGEIKGFINFRLNRKSITILNLGVKKKYHRKGLGTKLLRFLEKIAHKNKINDLRLETLTYEDNYKPYKLTRDFYLKNGFIYKYIKRAKKLGFDDLVIMEKKLK